MTWLDDSSARLNDQIRTVLERTGFSTQDFNSKKAEIVAMLSSEDNTSSLCRDHKDYYLTGAPDSRRPQCSAQRSRARVKQRSPPLPAVCGSDDDPTKLRAEFLGVIDQVRHAAQLQRSGAAPAYPGAPLRWTGLAHDGHTTTVASRPHREVCLLQPGEDCQSEPGVPNPLEQFSEIACRTHRLNSSQSLDQSTSSTPLRSSLVTTSDCSSRSDLELPLRVWSSGRPSLEDVAERDAATRAVRRDKRARPRRFIEYAIQSRSTNMQQLCDGYPPSGTRTTNLDTVTQPSSLDKSVFGLSRSFAPSENSGRIVDILSPTLSDEFSPHSRNQPPTVYLSGLRVELDPRQDILNRLKSSRPTINQSDVMPNKHEPQIISSNDQLNRFSPADAKNSAPQPEPQSRLHLRRTRSTETGFDTTFPSIMSSPRASRQSPLGSRVVTQSSSSGLRTRRACSNEMDSPPYPRSLQQLLGPCKSSLDPGIEESFKSSNDNTSLTNHIERAHHALSTVTNTSSSTQFDSSNSSDGRSAYSSSRQHPSDDLTGNPMKIYDVTSVANKSSKGPSVARQPSSPSSSFEVSSKRPRSASPYTPSKSHGAVHRERSISTIDGAACKFSPGSSLQALLCAPESEGRRSLAGHTESVQMTQRNEQYSSPPSLLDSSQVVTKQVNFNDYGLKHATNSSNFQPEPHQAQEAAYKAPVKIHEKPTYSYAALIGQAIMHSPQMKMCLNDIYDYIVHHYPYYKKEETGWQNSIRHNLSLNESFIKLPRGPNEPGKGCFWAIAPGTEDQFTNGGFKKRSGELSRRSRVTQRKKMRTENGKDRVNEMDTGASVPDSGSKTRLVRANGLVEGVQVHRINQESRARTEQDSYSTGDEEDELEDSEAGSELPKWDLGKTNSEDVEKKKTESPPARRSPVRIWEVQDRVPGASRSSSSAQRVEPVSSSGGERRDQHPNVGLNGYLAKATRHPSSEELYLEDGLERTQIDQKAHTHHKLFFSGSPQSMRSNKSSLLVPSPPMPKHEGLMLGSGWSEEKREMAENKPRQASDPTNHRFGHPNREKTNAQDETELNQMPRYELPRLPSIMARSNSTSMLVDSPLHKRWKEGVARQMVGDAAGTDGEALDSNGWYGDSSDPEGEIEMESLRLAPLQNANMLQTPDGRGKGSNEQVRKSGLRLTSITDILTTPSSAVSTSSAMMFTPFKSKYLSVGSLGSNQTDRLNDQNKTQGSISPRLPPPPFPTRLGERRDGSHKTEEKNIFRGNETNHQSGSAKRRTPWFGTPAGRFVNSSPGPEESELEHWDNRMIKDRSLTRIGCFAKGTNDEDDEQLVIVEGLERINRRFKRREISDECCWTGNEDV